MKIYLAGSWKARPAIREMRKKLEATGHECTSRWLDWPADNYGLTGMELERRSAQEDCDDIAKAQCVLISTEEPSSRGGFHTELGYALGLGKLVAIIGSRPSNFFHLPQIMQFGTLDGFLMAVRGN